MNFYKLYQILNEYGEGVIQTLIKKFKQEDSGLTDDIIRNYIERFERIKNNLDEKDITKYSWKKLENTVDGYRSKERIKAGRLDASVTDANLLYNQNGIRIYLGKDKKSCVRYSNGYTFCIGARGKESMYGKYRISDKGTPYFIFNDNLPPEDDKHLMVLFVYLKKKTGGMEYYTNKYTVTLASNQGDKNYAYLSAIIDDYPWVKPITNFISDQNATDTSELDAENFPQIQNRPYLDKGHIEVEPIEKLEHILDKEYGNELHSLKNKIFTNSGNGFLYSVSLSDIVDNLSSNDLEDFKEKRNSIITLILNVGTVDSSEVNRTIYRLRSFFIKNDQEIFEILKQFMKNYFKKLSIQELGLRDNEEKKEFIKNKIQEIEKNRNQIIENYVKQKKSKRNFSDNFLFKTKRISENFHKHGYGQKEDPEIYSLFAGKPFAYVYFINIDEEVNNLVEKKEKEINKIVKLKQEYYKNLKFLRTCSEEQLKEILYGYERAYGHSAVNAETTKWINNLLFRVMKDFVN